MDDSEDDPTLSIPTLVLLAVLSILILRWYLSGHSSSSSSSSSSPASARASSRGPGRRVNPQDVERIAQMFPQLSRREIMWDLQRNGGSVAATTDRVLDGGGLEVPPPSFQPVFPNEAPTSSNPVAAAPQQPPRPQEPDLITRYNLKEKIAGEEKSDAEDGGRGEGINTLKKKKQGWSQNKSERQDLLKRRRDEMILSARRKMMEREREKGKEKERDQEKGKGKATAMDES